jgi:hypothetical protein
MLAGNCRTHGTYAGARGVLVLHGNKHPFPLGSSCVCILRVVFLVLFLPTSSVLGGV